MRRSVSKVVIYVYGASHQTLSVIFVAVFSGCGLVLISCWELACLLQLPLQCLPEGKLSILHL